MSKHTRRTQIDNQECGFYQLYEDGKMVGRVSFDTLKAAPEMHAMLKEAADYLYVSGTESQLRDAILEVLSKTKAGAE